MNNVIERKLDDYYYHKASKLVVHFYKAVQPKNYNARDKKQAIRYYFETNIYKLKIKNPTRVWFFDMVLGRKDYVSSKKDKNRFFKAFKKISKLKAKLLW
jgi:hypothetical protein